MKLNQCFGIKLIIEGWQVVNEMGKQLLVR